jgi:putative DNA methylase
MARSSFSSACVLCQPGGAQDPRDKSRRDGPQIEHPTPYRRSASAVLDPTSGGGSIPFEALRLGNRVIANELNPVAAVILHATLGFPARFGPDLLGHIEDWGHRLLVID